MRRLWIGFFGVLLAACSNAPQPSEVGAQALRPAGSPDVAIFVVSGRCGVGTCSAPEQNWDYLGPQGTGQAVAQAFQALGYSTRVYSYSAHLRSHYSSISRKTEPGFLELEAQFKAVVQNWVNGFSNPTRIVLVGHSHGTNWTHNLTRIYGAVRFAYVIDLDGICYLWEDDNAPYFRDYYAQNGNPWGVDISDSCDAIPVKRWYGTSYYNAKDVAFANTTYNLEVQSKRVFLRREGQQGGDVEPQGETNFAYDYTANRRTNGSTTGIYTYVSSSEGHNQVDEPGSQALAWVKGQIQRLGLP